MSADPRAWECKQCGWVLGIIRENSNRVAQLDVYRQAAPSTVNQTPGVIELFQGVIVCSHCGARQEWHYSQRALERLIAGRQRRREAEHG